ncbi:uncharacterized protein LODBEIA_P21350 [Lodderomyces beijingensis]|uniref:RING-type domain-containing protein n=1 Tax=Lodderomyces beijingensis TaxID=1775926 RepID=A0ABP0ZLB7_9ASCO
MSSPTLIELTSDEEDGEIEITGFNQNENDSCSRHRVTKKLADIQCPICFDDVTVATTTSCGHIFCLECIEQSISSSRGRNRGHMLKGRGLCPLCRKEVGFKETTVMMLKKGTKVFVPPKT